jgi:hypothetical protein
LQRTNVKRKIHTWYPVQKRKITIVLQQSRSIHRQISKKDIAAAVERKKTGGVTVSSGTTDLRLACRVRITWRPEEYPGQETRQAIRCLPVPSLSGWPTSKGCAKCALQVYAVSFIDIAAQGDGLWG